jgi:hypothetical protein
MTVLSKFRSNPAEAAYQQSRSQPTELPDTGSTGPTSVTDSTEDREVIQRIELVFQRILEVLPEGMKKDWRYTAMRTIMFESIKDLRLIPDEVIIPMMREFAQAISFIADGSMEEYRASLEEAEDDESI